MTIYVFHDTSYNVPEFGATKENDRIDVTYIANLETKKDFIDKIMALPHQNQSSRGWIIERAHSWNGDGNVRDFLIDDSIYVQIGYSTIIGKYINNQWFKLEGLKEVIWRTEPDKISHPSFGTINFNRVSCSEHMNLFGSSIKQSHVIQLEIHHAVIQRDLQQDNIYSKGLIVSAYLSPSQFADAITSLNSESVPCTINFVDGHQVPEPLFENKRVQFDAEFEEKMNEIVSDTNRYYKKIAEILSKPNLGKHDREEILKQIDGIKMQIGNNIPFIKEQFTLQMDETVVEAKNQITAFLDDKLKRLGLEKHKEELKSLENLI
jgi:hypothetical protein